MCVVFTEELGWATYFKLWVVELLVDKFASDVFAPDMTNDIL
jgi:hypothetical protein